MKQLFREEARPILIMISKKESDKYGFGGKSTTYSSYISVDAIVSDVDYARVSYKMPGAQVEEAKEIVIEKENLNLFLMSKKIIIDSVVFYGWSDNSGKNRYKAMSDFISAYIYRRK